MYVADLWSDWLSQSSELIIESHDLSYVFGQHVFIVVYILQNNLFV